MLLSLGFAAQGAASGEMAATMIAAPADVLLPQNSDDCGADEAMPEIVCYAVCSGSTAVLPHTGPFKVVALEQSKPGTAPAQTSRRATPDPYPPKPATLS